MSPVILSVVRPSISCARLLAKTILPSRLTTVMPAGLVFMIRSTMLRSRSSHSSACFRSVMSRATQMTAAVLPSSKQGGGAYLVEPPRSVFGNQFIHL